MNIFRLFKRRFTSTLITLLMTMQMVACSSGDTATAATTDIGSDPTTETANNQADIITLSWVAPALREDNNAISLADIAGYKVYYGTTQGQYSGIDTISDGSAVDHIFTDLPVGTYYFVVTTIDTEGRESQPSPEVTITVVI